MKADDIKLIGVLGGGVMGGGIAQVFATAGYGVVLRDLTDELLERTRATVIDGRFGLKAGVARGKIDEAAMEKAAKLITYTKSLQDLANVDLLVEAVPENLELKRQVFAELDTLIKPEAIFASNTSGFTIADLHQAVARKDRFVGMHWFSPVPAMKLVEVVYTPDTSQETIEAIEGISAKSGKVTVRVKDAPGRYGFIANRIFMAAATEARKIMEEGVATADDIDTAMKLGYNWPVGPLEMGRGTKSGWTK